MSASPTHPDILDPWSGPHGGAPPFDKVRVEDFAPAMRTAMQVKRDEIAAIADDPAPASFANTLGALEDSGRALARIGALYGVFASTMNDAEMQAVEQALAPELAAFADEVIQNPALFARIRAVHEAPGALTAEQKRLAETTFRRFARRGAGLSDSDKARMAAINQRLAVLSVQFSQNELADEEDHFLTLTSPYDLAGLPPTLVGGAASAARAKGLEGAWVIANTRSAMEPFLTHARRRDLREKGWRMWISRGDNGGAHDNNAIITEILALRSEKARLLGFPTFAHWVTDDQMAGTPGAAMDLMLKVWAPARAAALREVDEIAAFADDEIEGGRIEAWDWRYLAEKARKAKYDLDDGEVRPYLQLEKLREAMFWVVGELFGLSFSPLADLPVYEPTVRVFEVRREGRRAGLWYFDPYARAGKSSGAWMSEYRTQERFAGEVTPIVSNNANFMKPEPGEPVLISWADAVTLFHEFGHALHGLISNVTYPSLAGTNVARDFVEFPSQLMERWLPTREVLTRFCTHWRTGEPMPDDLAAKIERAHVFNRGFETVEYLASAIVDMRAHLRADPADPRAFEVQIMAEIGMPQAIVMRHRLPHFGHLFAGEGYAAGYYDYIWADTLTADAAEAFARAPGGFYDRPVADRLRAEILSAGDTVDAGAAFRAFRGRDVEIGALMRDRGFPDAA